MAAASMVLTVFHESGPWVRRARSSHESVMRMAFSGLPATRSILRSKKSVNAPVHLGGVNHRLGLRPVIAPS